MSSTLCRDLFEREGAPIEAGNDHPFLLNGDLAWRVGAGRVDVFAVRLERGQAAGSRSYLFRVEEGGLLFGLLLPEDPAVGLLAVGTDGTRLHRLRRDRLREFAGDPANAPQIGGLLDEWVDLLCSAVARDALVESIQELRPGTELELDRTERMRPRGRVAWVNHESGSSLFLGKPGLEVNGGGVVPISHPGWLEVQKGTRLRVIDTDSALSRDEAWPGLERLHDMLLHCATDRLEAELARARERLGQKVTIGRRAYQDAWMRLASILQPQDLRQRLHRRPRPDVGATSEADILFEACRTVGDALGIEVKRPPPSAARQSNAAGMLSAVAWASRIRTRQVTLRDAWWREDAGPLLGFLRNDRRAVALLPAGRQGGYVLYDPARPQEQARVDAETADRIEPWAYTFYRPFDPTPLNFRDLIAFSFRGVSADLRRLFAMGIAAGLLSLLPPVATGIIFNDLVPSAARTPLIEATLLLVAIAIAKTLLKYTGDVALVRVDTRMGGTMLAAVWDRLLALPVPFFRQFTAGNLATRANALEQARNILSGTTVNALLGGIFSVFHFGLLLHYSPRLAVWAIGLISIAVLVSATCGMVQMKNQRAIASLQSAISGTVLQFLTSIAKLRTAGAEVHAFAIWARTFSEQRALQFRVRFFGNVLATFNTVFPVFSSMIIFVIALPLVTQGGMLRTGDFLAFLASFGMASTGILSATTALLSVAAAVPYYEQAKPILVATPEVDQAKADPGPLTGSIDLQDVSFRYSVDGPPILQNLSVHIPSSEFVAVVGPSGTGKSTLLRLLLGFEVPNSGAIYYDGQDLAGLDVRAVRSQIGVVLQSAQLIPGDIYTNIIGSASATLEEAWEAARMVGFDEDIKKMPMGMHTVIGASGGGLSGGQRQRLMIARALVRRPRMLFLDEATSALDNHTQAIVGESLERLQVTRVVIAHRLSTIERADRIFVLERGRVAQSGTFTELIEAPGLFAELARRQLA